ncbi:MAG: serine hydrolase domain-containing protein [Gemmatimonadaceae bacterium]
MTLLPTRGLPAGPRVALALAIGTAACGSHATPLARPAETVADTPVVHGPVAARIDSRLTTLRDSGFGGAVLVAVRDTIILSRGYGWTDSTGRHAIGPATRFVIASISKQFAAAGILALAERGRLALTDSLGEFFSRVPESARGITVHHLLTHTSGLPHRYAADGITDIDSAVSAVLASPRTTRPGEDFQYSNDGYSLVAAIIQVASGQPFDSFMQSEIIQRAGLRHTTLWGMLRDGDGDSVARIPGNVGDNARRANWGFRGASGMWSTTTDLYRWFEALRDARLLSRESVRLLMHPHVTVDSSLTAGYGWFTSRTAWGPEIWTRGTESFGHNAAVRWFPERETVVIVASNTGQFRGAGASRTVSHEIVRMMFEPAS